MLVAHGQPHTELCAACKNGKTNRANATLFLVAHALLLVFIFSEQDDEKEEWVPLDVTGYLLFIGLFSAVSVGPSDMCRCVTQ